jgi:hypothetical protein
MWGYLVSARDLIRGQRVEKLAEYHVWSSRVTEIDSRSFSYDGGRRADKLLQGYLSVPQVSRVSKGPHRVRCR